MGKTFRISFSLRNTYRVNSILYALKQIPLLKRILPGTLYRVRGFKIFANVISALWEVISVFLGKALYLGFFLVLLGLMYGPVPAGELYPHLLLFLTVIGAFMNTYMFNPTRDKYYAMILMRMDAKSYTLVNYGYALLKLLVGFLVLCLWGGCLLGVPLWFCALFPFSVAGLKMAVAVLSLWEYEKTGQANNENKLGKFAWIITGLLLAAAYGLPALGILVPLPLIGGLMALSVAGGFLAVRKIVTFDSYRDMYQQILTHSLVQMDNAQELSRQLSQKNISADTSITSSKKGFEYLNDLFVKRHRKILWRSSTRQAQVILALVAGGLLGVRLSPEFRDTTNRLLMVFLPYFVFIMYSINRGTGFTRALFMNCDHSLLTYAFYKEPAKVLKLFRIRLREITKVNLLPAAVLGCGLALLLWASGGTDNPLNYGVIVVSILCLSVFFSVHYLTIYYLLQPYNAGTEMKSGTYQLVLWVTYFVCFLMMQLRMDTLVFGLLTIVFCVAYSAVACLLVYRFGPRTFRLRQ